MSFGLLALNLSLALGPDIAAMPTSEGDWFHTLFPGCAFQRLTAQPDSSPSPDSEPEEITGTDASSRDSTRCPLLDSWKLFIFPCCCQGYS